MWGKPKVNLFASCMTFCQQCPYIDRQLHIGNCLSAFDKYKAQSTILIGLIHQYVLKATENQYVVRTMPVHALQTHWSLFYYHFIQHLC